jgi:cell division GTPase FtsZ
MKDYLTKDFPGYAEAFQKNWVKTVELMRILKEVLENEGMEIPTTKQLCNMVSNSIYEVNLEYEDINKIEKEEGDSLIYVSSNKIPDLIRETIKTEFQSLKNNDDQQ